VIAYHYEIRRGPGVSFAAVNFRFSMCQPIGSHLYNKLGNTYGFESECFDHFLRRIRKWSVKTLLNMRKICIKCIILVWSMNKK